MLISTKGLNIVLTGHFNSLQAVTGNCCDILVLFRQKQTKLTFHSNLVLTRSRMSKKINLNRDLTNWTVFLCGQVCNNKCLATKPF